MFSKTIEIRKGSMFPWTFQLLGALAVFFSIPLLPDESVSAALIITLGLVVLTAATGTEVDLKRKSYRQYSQFFWLAKFGTWKPFEEIEKVFVSTSRTAHRMYTAHTNHSSVFSGSQFHLYLKLSDGTKIQLFSAKGKERLLERAYKVAASLNCPLEDNV